MPMNPTCDCGELMERELTAELAFDYVPGSPEIRRVFQLSAAGHLWVWACWNCGAIVPELAASVTAGASFGRAAGSSRGSRDQEVPDRTRVVNSPRNSPPRHQRKPRTHP